MKMKKFEVGKTYTMKSPCDHNCKWSYVVISRKAQTVTLLCDDEKVLRCRISKQLSEFNKTETVLPLGRYSMCPSLRAN